MKHIVPVVLAALPLFIAFAPARAASVEDAVRVNCTREIVGSTDVDRNKVKSFRIAKQGGGYTMSGPNEANQTVTCETAEDGRVTWVKVN